MVMKLGLMLTSLPLAALLLGPPAADPDPPAATSADRACATSGARLGHETVRIPWTLIRTVDDDVDVMLCVFRGDPHSPLEFARDADRVYLSLMGRGDRVREGTYSFEIHTSTGRAITVGPARVRVQPRNRRSCRVEICQAFTEPGERVKTVLIHTH